MELLFERRDEEIVPYAIVNGSMARTFAIEGSCIGLRNEEFTLRPYNFDNKGDRTLQDGIAAYIKAEKDEEMFGESDGELNQKRHILKLYQ